MQHYLINFSWYDLMRIMKKIKSGSLFPCCCFKRKTRPPENMPATPLEKKDSDLLSSSSALSSEGNIIHEFTLEELGVMTQSFSGENFIGEGEFGPVHKGFIHDQLRPGLTAQPVVIKVLDFYPTRDYQEWLREVKYLGQLRHPNLVKLIGYSCEEEHKLLVYEYISGGSLDTHLFTRDKCACARRAGNSVSLNHHLPWSTRMRIAVGAARGVAFLHQQAQRPVLFRQFIKPSNILLDSDYNVKLSDFGFVNNDMEVRHAVHVKSPVFGYTPPEYIETGYLTLRSDVYSFGVVLLELLTGRRAIDKSLQVPWLVNRACPHLNDPRKLRRIIDPRLEGIYSEKGSRVVASLASSCLSDMPKSRPTMSKVVATLESLKDYMDT